MNIFEKASRENVLFATSKGQLVVNALWNLPITGKGLSLDSLFRQENAKLKDEQEEGLFATTSKNSLTELRVEIIKHIATTLKAEKDAAKAAAATKKEIDELTAMLNEANRDALKGDPAAIKKRLAELGA